jgi:hypothetical protein
MIEAGRRRLEQTTRFDMANFKPPDAYVRELKKYGVLPATFDNEVERLDVYAADRRYWDLFEYDPPR